mgnify:CR=1 FL=1
MFDGLTSYGDNGRVRFGREKLILVRVVWTTSAMMDGIARSSAKSRSVILFIIVLDYVLRISMDKNEAQEIQLNILSILSWPVNSMFRDLHHFQIIVNITSFLPNYLSVYSAIIVTFGHKSFVLWFHYSHNMR